MQLREANRTAIRAPSISVVLLAGRIRAAHRMDSLEIHMLGLPVGQQGSLLDAWLATLELLPNLTEVQVIVNTPREAESVAASMTASLRPNSNFVVRIIAEPAAWRGAAGIVRDVTGHLGADDLVLVCEAKRIPPRTLHHVLETHLQNKDAAGVVGLSAANEPAGIYLFSADTLELIPKIGYFDLKEQFLPAISGETRRSKRIVATPVADAVWRISDLQSYITAVRATMFAPHSNAPRDRGGLIRVSDRASISASASLEGCCIVEAGAVIEDGAVVHDSVVLWGATIGGGAVVSRSVIGPLASVEPRSRVVRELIVRPASQISGSFNQSRFTAALTAQ